MSVEIYRQNNDPDPRDGELTARRLRAVEDRFEPRSSGPYERLLKRPMDAVMAGTLLLVLSPVLLVVAAAIRMKLGKGAFFSQERVGLHSQPFTILKFRTMKHDRRDQSGEQFNGPDRRMTHKTLNDPRHTKMGTFLRRYALDELPQLINVLRGEMSMVGPRPELYSVALEHNIVNHRRHQVLPGITGPWQLSGSRDEFISQNLSHDEYYVDNVTLRGDIGYLLRTVGLFNKGKGA